MTYINVIDGIDVGYAYETPSNTALAGQNIKTHEIFFRLRLGENVQTQQEDQEQGEWVVVGIHSIHKGWESTIISYIVMILFNCNKKSIILQSICSYI